MRLLPRQVFGGPEGLVVLVSQEDGTATFRAGCARLTPERSVELAFGLLDVFAPPTVMDAIEREVRAERLRLVEGGGEGGDAA